MTHPRPLLLFGTRPEAIKMAPVIRACVDHPGLEPVVVATAQHRELLDLMVSYFELPVHHDLELMRPQQDLTDLTARALTSIGEVIDREKPSAVVAQGDTTTVLCASLAAFYRRVPFVHVEAGLRSHDLSKPWPEELNRRVAGIVAQIHCAPTESAADNLRREGIPDSSIHVTGNPVVDSLLWAKGREEGRAAPPPALERLGDRVVTVTAHRRESHGGGLEQIFKALAQLAEKFADVTFVLPVHPSPAVKEVAEASLSSVAGVRLVPPLSYGDFVWLMNESELILTDSGGVQEEAPTFGVPVLVMREVTERNEVVKAGLARVVGLDSNEIVRETSALLEARKSPQPMSNPFGDGHSGQRIAEIIARV